MEQVTEYNNVTREVKIQVRIFRELEDHGAGHTLLVSLIPDRGTYI
jgi:hypothetical protein